MILRNIFVYPRYPEKLRRLFYFAYNLWTLWDAEALQLFNRIDPTLFMQLGRNPVKFLYSVPLERLEELSQDKGFIHDLDRVWERYEIYEDSSNELRDMLKDKLIAYFSKHEPFYPRNLEPYVFHDWIVDCSKAQKELLFTPSNFHEGARRTLDWYRSIGYNV